MSTAKVTENAGTVLSEQPELTPEEQELLDGAIKNLQSFIETETTHYVLIEDPRNDEDYDTFEYGTEPLPGDQTWHGSATVPPRPSDPAE